MPAKAQDVPVMLEIRLAVTENVLSAERLAELGINADSLVRMLEASHVGFCAKEGDETVGFSMADVEEVSIFALFVRPDREGRGIGKRLLDAAVADLMSRGHEHIELCTEPNTRAFEFYRRQGWRHVGFADNGDARLVLGVA